MLLTFPQVLDLIPNFIDLPSINLNALAHLNQINPMAVGKTE
jgi:hypothetical protein